MKCLSIRQPWAHLIINGPKDVENRDWETAYRGPLLIHAGLTVETHAFAYLARYRGIELDRADVRCGFILGAVDLIDCRRKRTSTWHQRGYVGWSLANPRHLRTPIPYKRKLELFEVPNRLLPKSWRP